MSVIDAPNLTVAVTDVNGARISVRLAAVVVADEELQVSLLHGDWPVASTRARARWCRPVGGGLHAAGLLFSRPLTLAEFAELVY